MTDSPELHDRTPGYSARRVADLHLRSRAGPMPARVYWPARTPGSGAPALLVLFDTRAHAVRSDRLCRDLCGRHGLVVLAVAGRATSAAAAVADATTVLEWAGDHAAELAADPTRLLVADTGGTASGGGAGLAEAAAQHARDRGWPPVTAVLRWDVSGFCESPSTTTIDPPLRRADGTEGPRT